MNRFTLSLVLLLAASSLFSQEVHKCATDEFTQELISKDPSYHQKYIEAQNLLQNLSSDSKEKAQADLWTIPVVVHIIYNDYRDNISRAQIEDALRVLNEDFRRMNADASNTRAVFQGVASDVEIEFELAKLDPNGNCTDGITRTQSSQSIDAHDNVKNLINWNNSNYFNIWVVNSIANNSGTSGTILGYAYFPVSGSQNFSSDGMVIRHDQMGTIGTALTSSVSDATTQKGRTITHEAGHYLGVRHTFNQGCFGGDGVSDTPPVSAANDGCDFTTNTCSNDSPDLPDMIENYMDYSDGACQNMFTAGQTAIMRSSLSSTLLRQNLRSATNLVTTGITNPPDCLPIAIASSDKQLVCPGETIDFTDISEDGDPTSWNWSFPGGTPSSSTQEDVTVTYNTPGIYSVTLTVSNGAGSDTQTYDQYISVKNTGSPAFYPNWTEDFEAASLSSEVTVLDAGDGIDFELFTQAGSSGNNSLKLDNFNSDIIGEQDWVISPAISTNFTSGLNLSFDYAFAAQDDADDDELRVYASTDCGQTWILRRFYRGNQLRTAANTSQSFTPADASEWGNQNIGFDAYIGPDPLLVRFEFTNGGGNNFYLDNINFSGTIGLDEYQLGELDIYPNPTSSDLVNISSQNFDIDGAEISLTDLSGKLLFQNVINGRDSYTLNAEELALAKGVYVIAITKGQERAAERLIIK